MIHINVRLIILNAFFTEIRLIKNYVDGLCNLESFASTKNFRFLPSPVFCDGPKATMYKWIEDVYFNQGFIVSNLNLLSSYINYQKTYL